MNEEVQELFVKNLVESGLIKTSNDMTELISSLQAKLYQSLLEGEIEHHLKSSKENKRNGYAEKPREIRTKAGATATIHMPRDRNSSFNPIIVPKRKRVVDDFSDVAILLFSKGNTLEDIQELIKQIYKIDLSKSFISELITKVSEDVTDWQNRPLKSIYAITYVDCLYCNLKVNGFSKKAAVYVMIGIGLDGKKEVVGIWIGDGSESASFWTEVFLDIKNRGVEDILYMSMDGLSGLESAVEVVYPLTKTQRCVVHIVRNLFKLCPKKTAKDVISDFKNIYKAYNLEEAKLYYKNFLRKYESSKTVVNYVNNNIDHIFNLFSETEEIRRLIYTTNAIESVNSSLRKVTSGKGMFMNKESLMRVLYLRIKDLEKKWNIGTKNWDKILNDLIIQYEERLKKYI